MARKVAVTMPPRTLVPMAFMAPAPAPLAMASGSTPKPNASEVMTIGPQPEPGRLEGGLDQAHPLLDALVWRTGR